MISIWQETVPLPEFPSLEGDIKTDVLIIGGGIAGILCAYFLQQEGINYTLVEANKICTGVTGCTTAKITSQHGLIYSKITKEFNLEKAQMYLKANENALKEFKELCKNIPCDFEEKNSYVFSDNKCKLENELNTLLKIGYKADFKKELPLPISTAGAIEFQNQAQFNPLKFINGICKGLNIYENTRIKEFDGKKFTYDKGSITADKTIVATHFPIFNKHGSYFLKMYQHRSYVLALDNAPDSNGMYVDDDKKGLSFRNYNGLLLLGGGSHRTGKKGGNWQELEDFASKHYNKSKILYRFATQDCMTLDGVPYIGRYSEKLNDIFVATGFNKWGMTSSMVAAKILKDEVAGKNSEFSKVFDPSRTMLRMQLAVNGIESVCNLLSLSEKRCPHLGCALKWNPVEHSWDCPCHGSRFSHTGKLLNNPSNNDIII